MRALRNRFLIKADTDSATNLNLTGLDGEPIVINKRFNPLHHVQQYGEIVATPFSFDEGSMTSRHLKVGDKIFFHYLVCQDENKIDIDGEIVYLCSYDQIWASIEGDKIIPVDNVLFAKHIVDDNLQSESGLIIKQYETNVAHILKVYADNRYINSKGIYVGDTIVTVKGAGVPIKDSDIVWLKLFNIIGKYDEATQSIVPLKGKNIILEDEKPDITMWKNLMVGNMHREKFCTGKVLYGWDVENNSSVTYLHSMYSRFKLNGIKYSVIENKDLISVNNKLK